MKEIRYTLGDSPLWHSLHIDYDLTNEVRDDVIFANLITQELRRMGIQGSAKQVKVFDENNKEIAYSKDISEIAKLNYTNYENK